MTILKKLVILIIFVAIYLLCSISWSSNSEMSKKALRFDDLKASLPIGTEFQDVKKYLTREEIEFFIERYGELTKNQKAKIDFEFSFRVVFVVPENEVNETSSIVTEHLLATIYFNEDSKIFKFESRKGYSSF